MKFTDSTNTRQDTREIAKDALAALSEHEHRPHRSRALYVKQHGGGRSDIRGEPEWRVSLRISGTYSDIGPSVYLPSPKLAEQVAEALRQELRKSGRLVPDAAGLIDSLGMTNAALAEELEISERQVYNWRSGTTPMHRLAQLAIERLAELKR